MAIALGLRALLDRSKYVRFVACRLLAFAQDPKTIEHIEAARAVKGDIDGDFAAAIDAIRSQNHHYFVDREHSGHIKMDIVDLVDPNTPLRLRPSNWTAASEICSSKGPPGPWK